MTHPVSLPQAFLERLTAIYPPTTVDTIVSCLYSPRKTSFRINPLKADLQEVLGELETLHMTVTPVSFYEDAFIIEKGERQTLIDSSLFRDGKVYIQSLSSMLAVLALEPKTDDYILDIAAAPGSKTTMMASLMKNTGTIVANDVSPKRLHKLKTNLSEQGVTNTTIMHIPGERIWQKYPEVFDKALVDVPCSMEGRFVTSDPKTYEDWTPKKGKILSSKQQHILRSAVSSVRVGGTIIYTTCTLSVEENEMVVDWLLKKEGDGLDVEEIPMSDIPSMPGVSGYKKKQFHSDIEKTVRILPTETMEGFYIAKIKKVKSTVTS